MTENNTLLSIRDENTILITARFYMPVFGNKVADYRADYYDIELIVKNDITCDKLLSAIEKGLKAKLEEKSVKQEELDNRNVEIKSYDLRHDFNDEYVTYAESIPERLKSLQEQEIYQKCLNVFQLCYKAYCNPKSLSNYERELRYREKKEEHNGKLINKIADIDKEKRKELHELPRILVDCVDYKKYEQQEIEQENSAYGIGDAKQLWLIQSRDGKKRLSESKVKDEEGEKNLENSEINVKKERESLGFLTSTRLIFTINEAGVKAEGKEQHILLFSTSKVRDGYKETVPLYNISNRPLYQLNQEPIKIIPPTEPPEKNNTNVARMLLAPIIMNVGMISVMVWSGTNNNGNSMIIRYGLMAAITFGMTVWGYMDQRKEFKKALNDWKEHYQEYIKRILADIHYKQEQDIEQLKKMYPSMLGYEQIEEEEKAKEKTTIFQLSSKKRRNLLPPNIKKIQSRKKLTKGIVHMCEEVHPDIFSRGPEHPDFLAVRLGLSGDKSQLVASVFPIIGEKKDYVFTGVRYKNIDCKMQNKEPFEIIIPEPYEVKGEKRDYLISLPARIAEKYGYLKKAPVLLRLKECGTLGVVFPRGNSFYPFLDTLILNLSFYQSPDDLQIVLFGAENQKENNDLSYLIGNEHCENEWIYRQSVIDKYKHLPHFRELLGDLSAFVFCQKDANLVFNRLLEILSERKENKEETKYPHILLIFQDEYDFKRHPVSEYLPEYSSAAGKRNYGISFVFCKRFEEELPKYCGQIILGREKKNGTKWYLMPHEQTILREEEKLKSTERNKENNPEIYEFLPDDWNLAVNDLDVREDRNAVFRAYKTLSALYYYRIAQGAGVPEFVSLFDLIIDPKTNKREPFLSYTPKDSKDKFDEDFKKYICGQWNLNSGPNAKPLRDITKSLAAPIGKKAGGEIVALDLHEIADGPHMLVAGTTGSGKTETILTYLVQLCLLYTPEQVNLLLMDMKGAGFVKRIGHLPHVVGTVTDIDGEENGTSTVYMLKRFLHSMNAEIKRRKLLLNKMDVDSVDGYIKAKNDLDKHIANKKELTEQKAELEKLPQLAHLFVVVDEFTELMRFTAENSDVDFKSEITSLARIGRSLGFHIILISQNIENAITSDIRVNSKARLCLKVATREASREMIGTDLAASPLMPGNGRAYLLVGTGSRFEYFQSGYSGGSIIENPDRPYKVTQVEMSGRYTEFFDSQNIDEKAKKEEITQIEELSYQIRQCYKNTGKAMPRKVFQSPLPKGCFYDFDWDSKSGKYREMKIETEDKNEEKFV